VVSPPARKASVGVISVASAERDDASVAPSLGDRGARPRHIKVRTKNKDQKECVADATGSVALLVTPSAQAPTSLSRPGAPHPRSDHVLRLSLDCLGRRPDGR
jgi:hypothetical protein